ncbi:MAG: hypothetical protein OHK0022_03290 [Roseiflexaceae bacterium]
MTNTTITTPWALRFRPSPQAKLRLFCLHYAGGGASVFQPWAGLLPPQIELWGVQLPGRERRLREAPFVRMAPLADAVTDALRPLLDRPFALFGHSMGALLSFELARRLRREGGPLPVALLLSAHRAPHMPRRERPIHNLPEPELIDELRRLNGTPEEVLSHPELLELLLPLIRADFAACETYEYTEEPPLDCPISVFGGMTDPLVNRDELDAWSTHTAAAFSARVLPGDHFFLHKSRPMLLQALSIDLRPHL